MKHDDYMMPKETAAVKAVKEAIKLAYAEQFVRKGLHRKGADTHGKRTQ